LKGRASSLPTLKRSQELEALDMFYWSDTPLYYDQAVSECASKGGQLLTLDSKLKFRKLIHFLRMIVSGSTLKQFGDVQVVFLGGSYV